MHYRAPWTDHPRATGGVVEGHPHDTEGAKVSVLYNSTPAVRRAGFTYLRPKGKRNCVMRTTVTPADVRTDVPPSVVRDIPERSGKVPLVPLT